MIRKKDNDYEKTKKQDTIFLEYIIDNHLKNKYSSIYPKIF